MAESRFAFAQHLSWQPFSCKPFLWPCPFPSSEGIFRGLGLLHRPGSPWYAGTWYATHVMELVISASGEEVTSEADKIEAPATLQPWDPASFETSWEDEWHRSRRRSRALAWPKHVLAWLWLSFESIWELFPGTIFVGWETACFWQSWPWAPDALGGWSGSTEASGVGGESWSRELVVNFREEWRGSLMRGLTAPLKEPLIQTAARWPFWWRPLQTQRFHRLWEDAEKFGIQPGLCCAGSGWRQKGGVSYQPTAPLRPSC